jgi:hypothetical protein
VKLRGVWQLLALVRDAPRVVDEVRPLAVDAAEADRRRVADLVLDRDVELVDLRGRQVLVDRRVVAARADRLRELPLGAVPRVEVEVHLLRDAAVRSCR